MTANILVIGAVNVDLVVNAERLPGPGETVVGAGVERHGGGKGANAAVAAARAGAAVRYCGAVGHDDAGIEALHELVDESIDVDDVARLANVATGMALIVVDPAGENQIAVGAGANAAVSPEVTTGAVQRAFEWAGCVLVSTEISSAAVTAAVQGARENGLPCVLNPAPVSGFLLDLLQLGPILTPNATELADLFRLLAERADADTGADASTADMARAVAAQTGAPVVVTLGGDGVLVVDGTTTSSIAAPHVPVVRDTTGAGDTFNGVFAAALAEGNDVLSAAARGVAAASLSVEAVGARAGMPTRAAIDAAGAVGVP